MADPDLKARILAEEQGPGWNKLAQLIMEQPDLVFALDAPHDQEPSPDASLAAMAARTGRPVMDLLYDLTLERDGDNLLMWMFGGYSGSLDDSLVLLPHRDTVLGLGDGGAHCSVICDAGYPTFLLAYWARERSGGRLSLESAIKLLTSEPAELYGLHDRGVVAPGRKADVNIIDVDRVALRPVEIVHDLPAGAKRVIQRADGYAASVVSGQVVQRAGEDTGARPGRVVRGARPAA